jgi:hypothetical protein
VKSGYSLIVGVSALFLFAAEAGVPPAPAAPIKPSGPLVVEADRPNTVIFPPARARFVRFVIHASTQGEPCIDELEVYGPEGKQNLALARGGAAATASSCLPGYAIHQIAHLNDGRYGNDHSWIAATSGEEWAQIELPRATEVAKVVFSRDRQGQFKDRLPVDFEIRLSLDGRRWTTVNRTRTAAAPPADAAAAARAPLPEPLTWDGLLRYAFLCERDTWERVSQDDQLSPLRVERPALPGGRPYWGAVARLDPLSRVLRQMADMIDRLAAKGLAVDDERAELAALKQRQGARGARARAKPSGIAESDSDLEKEQVLYLDARLAKRRLMFRDPDLAPLEKLLFVKRHAYRPSHNYSDILDSAFRRGGGVHTLAIPRRDGRLEPADGKLATLFDASRGIARDAVASPDAARIYFAYRPSDRGPQRAYWHLMAVASDGSGLRQLTTGPFHDYYPCPLPDGGLAFISTRCKCRFLCWRPQAFVLFRMDATGDNITPLSYANLSEWAPSVMRDGRILWTRSEYLDKGADFGHTLWAIRPDGTHPMLLFGNDTTNCYMNAHEVPGTSELCCTLISHGGDLNGPIGLVDVSRGPFNAEAVSNITPDVRPHYHMSWATQECFRDPLPVARDYFLVSHAPAERFGLYVIDRYGNRELLYLDPEIGSMCPTPLRPAETASAVIAPAGREVLSDTGCVKHTETSDGAPAETQMGQFTVADVYRGLEPAVRRGAVRYLRVCQEIRSDLEQLPDGRYRSDHDPFQDFYASPTHKVTGPYGWPSYVAKASLGVVPVEKDGSASFCAPAGKVLYFEVLDEHWNELQRMRSVVQLQPGEKRGCIGCHEHRTSAPPAVSAVALRRAPRCLEPPPWGPVAFSYEEVVQPVWNARCVRCHDANDKQKIDLSGTLDREQVPASYRTLISQGWVHYFDFTWGREHTKAAPLTFGSVQSRLWKVLDAGHYDVKLSSEEQHRVKCWTDLNCPLWPDYVERSKRPSAASFTHK